jgi:iron complex transport system substrate-binding protein
VPRIASFLASGTEIVAALGLKDDDRRDLARVRLAAGGARPAAAQPAALRSDDAGQRRDRPRGARGDGEHGSVYAIDEEARGLRPDVMLTQAVCEVCAVPTPGVADVVSRAGAAAEIVSLDAHTVQDILDSITQVGAATVRRARRRTWWQAVARIERVRDAVRDAARPRVLALEWLDPPFAPGHWVPGDDRDRRRRLPGGRGGRPFA